MLAAVPYSSQQAGGAQSRAIPYRSRQFGIGSSRGYAAFEWLGSTWCLRGWSQQPPGITPIPATQPLSKRPLSRKLTNVDLIYRRARRNRLPLQWALAEGALPPALQVVPRARLLRIAAPRKLPVQ